MGATERGFKMASKFKSGTGCFKCKSCGKETRETGRDNASVRQCGLCHAKGECEIAILDNSDGTDQGTADWAKYREAKTEAEFDRLRDEVYSR
jgi:hypothetical protein